jgi:hypothetical protein
LNPGPLAPQTSTLTGLSYIPHCKRGAKLTNNSDNAKKSLWLPLGMKNKVSFACVNIYICCSYEPKP